MFAPPVDEVYVPGFDTTVTIGAIAEPLEGAARPGHFDGVATVVAILFALVGAERAYFGLKDYQQVRVIRRMALDLALPTEVVALPTRSGSRTAWRCPRATPASRPAGRAAAPVIRRALLAGVACVGGGERDADGVRARCGAVLAAEPPRRARLRLGRRPRHARGAGDDRRPAGALLSTGRPDRGRPPDRQRAGPS